VDVSTNNPLYDCAGCVLAHGSVQVIKEKVSINKIKLISFFLSTEKLEVSIEGQTSTHRDI